MSDKKQLNTTTLKSVKRNQIRGNVTISHPSTSLASPPVNWNIECDLAYNNYLQALLKRQIVEKATVRYNTAIDDQLSMQTEYLFNAQEEKENIEQEVENYEANKEIERLFSTINETSDVCNRTLIEHNTNERLTELNNYLSVVCNHLSLKNIKAFDSQNEYDRFALLLQSCGESMKKIKDVAGDAQTVQELSDSVDEYVKMRKQIIEKDAKITDLQEDVVYLIFKTISDKFAVLHGYED